MITLLLGTLLTIFVGLLWRRIYVVQIGSIYKLPTYSAEDSVFLEEKKCFYLTTLGYVASLILLSELTYRLPWYQHAPQFSATLWIQACWFFTVLLIMVFYYHIRSSLMLLAVWDLIPVINIVGLVISMCILINWEVIWAGQLLQLLS